MRDPATRAADIHAHMLETYRRLLGEQRAAVAAMFGLLLAGRAPLLINCTAGKDRTGVLSALLLAALGVPLETVRTDYALTELIQDPRAPLFPVDPDGPFADRKSTRLNPVTNAQLVCRLLLEKKNKNIINNQNYI